VLLKKARFKGGTQPPGCGRRPKGPFSCIERKPLCRWWSSVGTPLPRKHCTCGVQHLHGRKQRIFRL